jgi:hypothetical protein
MRKVGGFLMFVQTIKLTVTIYNEIVLKVAHNTNNHNNNKSSSAHKTSLIQPLFIEVPVPSQESKQSCICVLN